ncbi:hypothetical protein HAX54_043813 [Datura stramonium]|uniref:Uncharacterized protein n=1 Tax=Datura stramonium TaxID=4076 RepID=A0ABS8RPF3_DATST|nr:hypothetical protein [Datura stramonium]
MCRLLVSVSTWVPKVKIHQTQMNCRHNEESLAAAWPFVFYKVESLVAAWPFVFHLHFTDEDLQRVGGTQMPHRYAILNNFLPSILDPISGALAF